MQAPHPTILELVRLDTLKTWSLIATLFGDLDGDALSGAQIRALLGHIGIKPEAIRVALHRLKTDGWITSRREGREAVYRMSQAARTETEAVAPSIYSAPQADAERWHIELSQDTQPGPGAIPLGKGIAIRSGPPDPSDLDTLALAPLGDHIPIWLQEALVPPRLLALARALTPLVASATPFDQTIDGFTFRLLALHHWRRIALRPGSQAHAALLPDGPIAECHRHIAQVLATSDRLTTQFEP